MSAASLSDDPAFVAITKQEFADLSQLIYEQFGINLTEKKMPLVRGRLSKVLKGRGLKSFSQYLSLVHRDETGLALVELIDRISTNHTFFFREADHFAFFQAQVLTELRETREVRFWCAGCATGEEAYTLAMLCDEWRVRTGFRGLVKILATDISVTALEHAQKGEYTDDRIRLVPPMFRRHLKELGPDRWVVDEALKQMILFKRLNFMDQDFPFQNQFHGIFCRNVMIYFDAPTKNELVRRVTRHLLPGHYFFIGHSETLGREPFDLEYVRPSVYRRPR